MSTSHPLSKFPFIINANQRYNIISGVMEVVVIVVLLIVLEAIVREKPHTIRIQHFLLRFGPSTLQIT